MFTMETIIDAVVKTNKQIVEKMVKDAASAKAINNLIDTQAACTRSTVTAITAMGSMWYKGTTESLRKVINTDYREVFKA